MRRAAALALAAALFGGCLLHEEEVVPPGEFYVELDPVAGTVAVIPEIGASSAGLEQVDVLLDGTVDSGPPDTLEAVGAVAGYGEAVCGLPRSFCADISLRSFLEGVRVHNTYVEITRQTPATGNSLLNSDLVPIGLGGHFGVYQYGVLDAAGTPGAVQTERWVIEDNPVALRLRARVMGTPLPAP